MKKSTLMPLSYPSNVTSLSRPETNVSEVFHETFRYTKPKRRTNLQQGADLSGGDSSTQSSLVGRYGLRYHTEVDKLVV